MKKSLLNDPDGITRVIRIVSSVTGISELDIISKNRKKEIAIARHVAVYFSHISNYGSLKYLGYFFNNRDHSTMINSIQRTEDYYCTNKTFRNNIDKICLMVNPKLKSRLEEVIA